MTTFPLDEKFIEALQLAHAWHLGQYRKVAKGDQATVPYLSHLMGVASIALEFGATQDEAIAALLHDALEDGPENLQPVREKRAETREYLRRQIQETFGDKVAELVSEATEETALLEGRKAPWAQRKGEYLTKLIEVDDPSALLVSASDKLHNARSIMVDVLTAGEAGRDAFFERFNAGKEGTLQYYRLLVRAYQAAPGGKGQPRLQALFAELGRTVSALETVCEVSEKQVVSYTILRNSAPTPLFEG